MPALLRVGRLKVEVPARRPNGASLPRCSLNRLSAACKNSAKTVQSLRFAGSADPIITNLDFSAKNGAISGQDEKMTAP